MLTILFNIKYYLLQILIIATIFYNNTILHVIISLATFIYNTTCCRWTYGSFSPVIIFRYPIVLFNIDTTLPSTEVTCAGPYQLLDNWLLLIQAYLKPLVVTSVLRHCPVPHPMMCKSPLCDSPSFS